MLKRALSRVGVAFCAAMIGVQVFFMVRVGRGWELLLGIFLEAMLAAGFAWLYRKSKDDEAE